ncbi:MAG: electron transfer flavoprotein subunit beta/FixA family protein [Pseudomonadota bacterium]
MNIIVCLKQIPDPEAPATKYSVDAGGKKMVPAPGVIQVVNPFDENAVEAGLQLKEAHGGQVTVLTLGLRSSQEALKRALRMGADGAVQVDGQGLPEPAPLLTGYLLAKAVEKIGGCDLVLCGRQAGDWDQGQVGVIVAEALGFPCVTIVKGIQVTDGNTLRVRRLTEEGYDLLELSTPAVLTVTNEINQPRLTSVAHVLRASKIAIPVWSIQDLGADPDLVKRLGSLARLEGLFMPEYGTQCQMISAETLEEEAMALAAALRERKLV